MRTLSAAVISANPDFRRAIGLTDALEVSLELPVAATEVGVEELERLSAGQPDLVVVEIDDTPELGLRLVEFLSRSTPGRPVLVAGPAPSAELLLEVMRAGAAEYLPGPLAPEALGEVVERLATRLGSAPAAGTPGRGRVYAFVGAKGGVGTTTLAANVAVELRRRSGEEVLLADFRFGLGDAAVHLGLSPRFHVVDVIDNLHRMDPGLLASFVASDDSGVQLLSSPGEADKIDSVAPEQVAEALRFLRTRYAYTVVDAPDPYSDRARAILAEADRVFLVVTPEVSALRNAGRIAPLLGEVVRAGPDAVRLVVNRFVPSRSVPVKEIQRLVGLEVQRTVASDPDAVTRSINEGEPVVLTRAAVARELARLAADLLGPAEDAAADGPGGDAGLFRAVRGWARGGGRRAGGRGAADPSSAEEPGGP